MSLTPDPPPNIFAIPSAERFPEADAWLGPTVPDHDPGPRYTMYLGRITDIQVFGRAGQPPSATLWDWITDTLENSSIFTDWWSYAEPFALTRQMGTAPQVGGFTGCAWIIELRTAAEVSHAAGGDPLGFESFAYTGLSSEPNMPPLDGKNHDGQTWAQVTGAGNSGLESPFVVRTLIREDLADGGAGARWAGRAFFLESLWHEFAHVTMTFLGEMYGSGFVVNNLCEMFGRAVGDFDDPSLPWDERVVEATAETFKDIVFPRRRYKNRTRLRLPESRFADFKRLMLDLIYMPYWETTNQLPPLFTHEDQFFENVGISSYTTLPNSTLLGFQQDNPLIPFRSQGFSPTLQFAWPLEGELRLRWNFDPTPLTGIDWAADYIFGPAPAGNPGNHTFPKFTAAFWSSDTSFVNLGTFFAETELQFWQHGDPADPATPKPPISGEYTILPPTVPGTVEQALNADDTLHEVKQEVVAIPDQGCVCFISNTGNPMPKYTLWQNPAPNGSAIWFDNQIGMPYLWPWVELSLRRVRFDVSSGIPWPYKVGTLTLGEASVSRIVTPHRVRGRTLRSPR